MPLQRTAIDKNRHNEGTRALARQSDSDPMVRLFSSMQYPNNKVDPHVAAHLKNPDTIRAVVEDASLHQAHCLAQASKYGGIRKKGQKLLNALDAGDSRKIESSMYGLVRYAGQGCEHACSDCSDHPGKCYGTMTKEQLKRCRDYNNIDRAYLMTADELRGAMCDFRDGRYKPAPPQVLNWKDEDTQDWAGRLFSTTKRLH